MLEYIWALASSLAYSSDVVWGKMALDEMPMYVFVFLLAACYTVVGITMLALSPRSITGYISNKKNLRFLGLAIVAIVIGTLLADVLMWYAIKVSPKRSLPAVVTLIHTAPIFSLVLVWMVYNEAIDWRAVMGIVMAVAGCILTVFYS